MHSDWVRIPNAAALLMVALLLPRVASPASSASTFWIYFGTYTGKNSKGIYACHFDAAKHKLTAPVLAAETPNPSYLAADPAQHFLFAVNETGDYQGSHSGSASSFTIDRRTGQLKALNTMATRGADPCHLVVDNRGAHVLLANYSGGSVAVLPILGDGSLGESSSFVQHLGSSVDPERQRAPHAHNVVLTPDNLFAVVADLGLDKLLVYRYDALKGALTPNDPPFGRVKPGSGPRHLAFHPNGHFAYVVNEMANTITAFAWDGQKGSFEELQTVSTLPAGFKGENTTAEIVVHPSGRFLYASNRGHDSIAIFAIDRAKGTLSPAGIVPTGGKEPRNFALDPTGNWLFAANQNSDNVVVFQVNRGNGRLTPAHLEIPVPAPVCVTFVQAK